ncbi:MAG: hypothetical protein SGJ17_01715 [Hyphomicrobiales bacterium]|nr:hypothetical protein [Hyphomicrobiales bacterium]
MFGLFRLLGLAALWEFFKRGEAGKRIGRAAVGVCAAVIAIALFFLVSRFLTTFDDIESQTIRIVYGVLVTLIFGGLVGFLYFYFRTPRTPTRQPQQLRPPSADRLQALFSKHGIMQGAGISGQAHKSKPNAPVVIAGLKDGGKAGVTAALGQAGMTDVAELPALSVWAPENEESAEMAAGARLAIFVADQDLRNYEVEFIKAVQAYGRDMMIAIDKSDRLTISDREEIAASIAAKFEGVKRRPEVVFIASAPLPVNAIVVSADGVEREETRTRKADIAALLAKIKG